MQRQGIHSGFWTSGQTHSGPEWIFVKLPPQGCRSIGFSYPRREQFNLDQMLQTTKICPRKSEPTLRFL